MFKATFSTDCPYETFRTNVVVYYVGFDEWLFSGMCFQDLCTQCNVNSASFLLTAE